MKAKNLDNPDEMGKFQETHKLPNLVQEEIENLNKPIPSKAVKSVMSNLPTKKSPGPNSEFYQTCKEKLMSILFKVFQNFQEEGTLPNSFCEVNITLLPKPNKDTKRKL